MVISNLSRYHGDLDATIPTIYETLDDILSRCGIKPKMEDPAAHPQKLSEVKNGSEAPLSLKQQEDIVLYLNDTSETLLAFMSTFPAVCDSFHRQGFVQRMACFYELIAPYFRQYLIDTELRKLKDKWTQVKLKLIKLCHVILHTCCIGLMESRYIQRILNI